MKKLSESIWSNKDVIIPMMDVQHIEKQCRSSDSADGTEKKGDLEGILVITKHTTWKTEIDFWENAIWISNIEKKAEKFIEDFCFFRYELDIKEKKMEKICPKCNCIVEGEDAKGDGVYIVYICDNCGFDFSEEDEEKEHRENCQCSKCDQDDDSMLHSFGYDGDAL